MPKPEKRMVEDPAAHQDIETAKSLPDAVNAEQSILGYAAVNGLDERDEIARIAYDLYNQRNGGPGDADGDWYQAEQEIRRRTQH